MPHGRDELGFQDCGEILQNFPKIQKRRKCIFKDEDSIKSCFDMCPTLSKGTKGNIQESHPPLGGQAFKVDSKLMATVHSPIFSPWELQEAQIHCLFTKSHQILYNFSSSFPFECNGTIFMS